MQARRLNKLLSHVANKVFCLGTSGFVASQQSLRSEGTKPPIGGKRREEPRSPAKSIMFHILTQHLSVMPSVKHPEGRAARGRPSNVWQDKL